MAGAYTVSTTDGTLLRVEEHGPRTGPTVVLAHGWTLTRRSWLPVIEHLVARGLRVVSYDQRGHGDSGRLTGAVSIRALGDDLATVLDVVSPQGPVVLGGHSMGGMTVMAYAGRHPESFAQRVAGVVLVATSAGDLHAGLLRTVEARAMSVLARMPHLPLGPIVTARGQRRLLFGVRADDQHVRLTRDQVAATLMPTVGRFFDALGKHDEEAALAQFAEVPTAILVGDCDRLTPVRHARRLAELVPHAQLRVLPDCGHMLAYEATDEVVDAVCSVAGSAFDSVSDSGFGAAYTEPH